MLKDRIAVVTGGSRGIGRAIAERLIKEGAHVVALHSGKNPLSSSLDSKDVTDIACDVSDYEETGRVMERIINEFGHIDILVNSAGITKDALLLTMKEEDFDRVVDVNLKGTFNTIKHVYRHMMGRRYGKIVNLSSIAGLTGNKGQVNYSASKAGVIGITRSVAKELAGRGVNCNAIAPGFISTDMTDAVNEKARAQILEAIPMKRAGEVSDIAELALFLVSDASSYITGQVIVCDGGLTI